jgi:hypothetical protein
MPNFDAATGTAYAEETQAQSGGRTARIAPVKLENNTRVFVRVLSSRFPGRPDSVITADTHRFVPVTTSPTAAMVAKAKENKREVSWPKTMWGICPLDRIFKEGDGYEAGYGNCLVHAKFAGQKGGEYSKPLDKVDRHTYAVVVLQDVQFEGTTMVSCQDVIESWKDVEGNEVKVPAIRYLAQSWRNIWSAAISAVAMAEREDILDEVFMIKREGTDFTVLLAQSARAKITEEKRAVYDKTLELMGFKLPDFILDHASAGHYDRFWGSGPKDKADDGDSAEVDGAAGTVTEPDASAGAVPDAESQSRIDDFASQLAGQAKDAGAKAEPADEDAALAAG